MEGDQTQNHNHNVAPFPRAYLECEIPTFYNAVKELSPHDFVAVLLYVYIFIAADCPHSILLEVWVDDSEFLHTFPKNFSQERLVWAFCGVSGMDR